MGFEWLLGIGLGLGLATAAGFRVFLPLLGLSLATYYDIIPVTQSMEWLGSMPAITTLASATVLEVLAYYQPWFDNLLDTIAVPLSGLAGTVVVFATLGNYDPYISWALAIIAGGGTAALISGGTAAARATSSVTTGGLGNPILATGETIFSTFMSIVSFIFPLIALLLAVIFLYFAVKLIRRFTRKMKRKRKISK